MKQFFAPFFLNVLFVVVLSESPEYSEKYAKVLYQGSENGQSRKNKLNLNERHREEVTEKTLPSYTPNQTKTDANSTINTEKAFDLTTERESEQINFARIQNGNIVKGKLVQEDERVVRVYADPEGVTTTEKDIFNDDKTEFRSSNAKIRSDDSETGEFSELEDLNTQGVYYIYHPTGLFQKVAYIARDNPENMEFSAQVKYENIAPIEEPIYTYDPRTFVLQRLQLI